MNRENCLKIISKKLAILTEEIKLLNSVNLYDINIISEDFYPRLLNLIYGYKLENVNINDKNAPAIDLSDCENRIAVQVTSETSSTKINYTIEKFIELESYKKYDRLIILLLKDKPAYTTTFKTNGKFNFDRDKDILANKDLIKEIRNKSIEDIKKIEDFLIIELENVERPHTTEASEVETIIDLIEWITNNKKYNQIRNTDVDPEYKIYKRFKKNSQQIISEYTSLYAIYGEPVEQASSLFNDEAKRIINRCYLQDISIRYLAENANDPLKALAKLVDYFESKLSKNGKRYDKSAIKFYLVSELIECNIFPNIEEDGDEN